MPTREELFAAYDLPNRHTRCVRMNFVESADGAVTLRGRSGPLGGATDRAVMQVLRAMADVLVVGAGTVRAEGYGGVQVGEEDAAWRIGNGLSAQPRIAVVSRALDLSPSHPFFARAVTRPIVVTCEAAAAEKCEALGQVADVMICGDSGVDLKQMVQALVMQGLRQVLCEGGPHLFGSLLEAGVVDEVCVTVAPRIVGGEAGRIVRDAPEADRHAELVGSFVDDDGFVFLRYAL